MGVNYNLVSTLIFAIFATAFNRNRNMRVETTRHIALWWLGCPIQRLNAKKSMDILPPF